MNLLNNKYFKRILISFSLLASSTTFANYLEGIHNHVEIIDFSDLSLGEIVTSQYESQGLIISGIENDSEVPVFASDFSGGGLVDTRSLSNCTDNGWPTGCSNRADILRLTFTSEVDNLSFNLDTQGGEYITFEVYNSENILIETLTAGGESYDPQAPLVIFSSSNISRIDGFQPHDDWVWALDNLTFTTSDNPVEPQTTPIEFSITSSALGYEAFGIDCDISLNSDDNCDTPGDLYNQQAVYVASSTIVGSQKVVTIGYASDEPNLTSMGFELHFDSTVLSLSSVDDVFAGAIAAGEVYGDNLSLAFGWVSLFGQFPGANQVNLATLTFDIIGYEPPTQPQQVISVNNTPKGVLGRTSVLEVAYDSTDNNNQLSGLGMRVHFDSSLLSFNEITSLIEQDIIVDGQGPFSDDADSDNDQLTDQYMLFGWASLYNNWPNTELPAVLMNIAFDVSENIDTNVISSTNINFTDTSFTAGYEFSAESYQLDILKATWDFDGNGQADALTDGLMMLRYLFGLRGDLVTNSAMSPESPLSSDEIVSEIEAAMAVIDIDADSNQNALTDGLLLLRYLFGLRDDSLTSGAVGPDATRSSNSGIENYLESHMPVN